MATVLELRGREDMPAALDAIVAELSESDRQERIDLLIDFAKNLPPLPDRLAAHKDASHRVEECQSPVYLFVEMVGDRVALYADAPIEAPTVRGFVSLLLEGLSGVDGGRGAQGAQRPGRALRSPEVLGMLRVRGLKRRAPADQGRSHSRRGRSGGTNDPGLTLALSRDYPGMIRQTDCH